MITNANDIVFRCSSLGYLMTEPRSKSEILSETTKTHLVDVFVSAKYGRREEITGRFLEKGNEREEDSITLYSRVTKRVFKKNDIRLHNKYITGELDLYIGEAVNKADETIDTKTSWSAHTFFRAINKELDSGYKFQGLGYCALSGAKKHTVAYCLVNGTAKHIEAEKKKAFWQFNSDTTNEDFIKKCKQIEKNHIFDTDSFVKENPDFEFHNSIKTLAQFDIPFTERLKTFEFDRDENEIEKIYNRIGQSREWMNKNLFKL